MQDGINLVDDGRLDAQLARAFEGAPGRRNSLGDGFHPAGDFFETPSLAELLAESPISAVAAEAGRNQISGTAQSLEGASIAAHRDTEPEEFCERAGHEGRFGVVAETKAIAHPGWDREDVFQGATELDTDDLVAGVNPKA